MTAISLASTAKAKTLSFVSSTSDLDNDHYVGLSNTLAASDEPGVPETDDLEGSRTGLKTGYGQTKWVSEKVLMEAGRRGLAVSIVRPGYVVGDSNSAGKHSYYETSCGNGVLSVLSCILTVTNTDDFIWRLVKGCIQLGLVPDMNNAVNMVPVNHVARSTSLSALEPPPRNVAQVYHITARPPTRFNDLLGSLSVYGYDTSQCEYLMWRTKLEQHVMEVQDNALFPLLHYVLDDLPTSTRSPELNDRNTVELLKKNGEPQEGSVDTKLVGKYLVWLINAGFLPAPAKKGELELPELEGGASGRAVGRTGH